MSNVGAYCNTPVLSPLRIFKIARIGTRDVTVEEAEDSLAACWAAGWAPEWCEAVDITDAVINLTVGARRAVPVIER